MGFAAKREKPSFILVLPSVLCSSRCIVVAIFFICPVCPPTFWLDRTFFIKMEEFLCFRLASRIWPVILNVIKTCDYIRHSRRKSSEPVAHVSNSDSAALRNDSSVGKYWLCRRLRRVNRQTRSIGLSSGLYGGRNSSLNPELTSSLHALCILA